jgi:hypothetical protein
MKTRRSFLLLGALSLAQLASAQGTDTTRHVPGTTVTGTVHDSVGHVPLAGAMVELVVPEGAASFVRTAVSDSIGRFTLTDVPDGRFTLGFFHPMLDSLGVEAPLREVFIDGRRPVRADLAIPSSARIRAAICGPQAAKDPGAVLVGTVRDAQSLTPVAGVYVTAEWLELSISRSGLVPRTPQLIVTTGESGWFAMCNVPSAGTLTLIANRGDDSTDRVEIQVPREGFLRRELYIGPAQTDVASDTTQRPQIGVRTDATQPTDSLPPHLRRVRTGNGQLTGIVVTAVGENPLADAQVSIVDGPQTRANERGEWTLKQAPLGTRMLDIRALGYYPERRLVDVVAGAAPVRIALATLKSVLDTVKVSERREHRFDPHGFEERSRSNIGRYLTAADVARRNPTQTSDIFRQVPGVRLADSTGTDSRIVMRGLTATGFCPPTIFINGAPFYDISADQLNTFMRPKDVAGIEIYAGLTAPAEYQQGLRGGLRTRGEGRDPCGSILIWTK